MNDELYYRINKKEEREIQRLNRRSVQNKILLKSFSIGIVGGAIIYFALRAVGNL